MIANTNIKEVIVTEAYNDARGLALFAKVGIRVHIFAAQAKK